MCFCLNRYVEGESPAKQLELLLEDPLTTASSLKVSSTVSELTCDLAIITVNKKISLIT